jgi:outer membrane receptor protein involved in Fe transport
MAKRITHKHSLLAWAVLSTVSCSEAVLQGLHAAELNTQVPTATEGAGFPVQINLPAQPLNQSIRQLANQTGLSISFDSELTKNKTAPAVKGFLSPQEALKKVLQGSGLQLNISGDSAVIKPEPEKNAQALKLDAVEVRAKRFYEIGPLGGTGLTKEQIPGNVQSISAKEIKEAHSLSITDLMNRKLQSVTVNDYQGNPFQMDVQYRGFSAGPQIGTPQGLSVFLDGIRVNEPFGDVVNWDLIPMNALASVDVFPGSNPIFGLNTLGGAFSMKTKDGFNNAGADAEVLTGSYGRKYLQAEAGWNNGTVGLFGAGNFFMEDGWRKNSPSKVNQFFGKASYRGDKLDLNLSTLIVGTDLTGNGVVPTNMYEQNNRSVFTSPDETKNRLSQFQLSGSYFVNDTFTVTGQVYRRNSRRNQRNADVYTDYGNQAVSQNFAAGDQYTCLFESNNQYGIPDYIVIDLPDPNDFSSSPFLNELFNNGNADYSLLGPNAINGDLGDYAAVAKDQFGYYANPTQAVYQNLPPAGLNQGDETSYSNFEASYVLNVNNFAVSNAVSGLAGLGVEYEIFQALGNSFYYTPDGVKHIVAFKQAVNGTNCQNTQANSNANTGLAYNLLLDPVTGQPRTVDGLYDGKEGIVDGIPTAVITNSQINQKVDGASFQLNWNLEKHKLMVGASIDKSYAEYNNSQQLGFFDAQRNGTLDPDRALDVYAAADVPISNNNFDGTSVTKSLYASETWTPVESVHVTGAVRYNDTKVRNTLAARDYGQSEINLSGFLNAPNEFDVCPAGMSIADCIATVPTGYRNLFVDMINPPETEKFSYYSVNPSLGATWQAREDVNLYANWSQGTRTPSVIELGCALDKTPVTMSSGLTVPRSVALGRSCQLPSTLAGDPYLPQVRAETFDIGARGRFSEAVEWNLGYYRTELKNDIYLVTYGTNQNFFDSIGKTRRQGLEMGLKANTGRARFSVNYALTDATFRSTFETGSAANSSATPQYVSGGDVFGGIITVKPGDRIPGVSLHNVNANFSYDITPDWTVGLGAVLHSWSYLRGNENNEHRAGVARPVIVRTFNPDGTFNSFQTVYRQPTTNPGKVPGYAVFNFQTSYKISKEWTANLLINNLFDREYFSAGRLGVNPFSPSINGAIGPDGYNHNSGDWLTTNFVAPGAPRGIWFSLNWHFVPDKQ